MDDGKITLNIFIQKILCGDILIEDKDYILNDL